MGQDVLAQCSLTDSFGAESATRLGIVLSDSGWVKLEALQSVLQTKICLIPTFRPSTTCVCGCMAAGSTRSPHPISRAICCTECRKDFVGQDVLVFSGIGVKCVIDAVWRKCFFPPPRSPTHGNIVTFPGSSVSVYSTDGWTSFGFLQHQRSVRGSFFVAPPLSPTADS